MGKKPGVLVLGSGLKEEEESDGGQQRDVDEPLELIPQPFANIRGKLRSCSPPAQQPAATKDNVVDERERCCEANRADLRLPRGGYGDCKLHVHCPRARCAFCGGQGFPRSIEPHAVVSRRGTLRAANGNEQRISHM